MIGANHAPVRRAVCFTLTRAQGLVIDQPAAEARAFVAERLAVLHLEQGRSVSAFRRASEALAKVADDFEDLGTILYAAEASAEAAVLLRHAGQTRRAAAVGQRAARLLARCEGAGTPPVRFITARVRLTQGELDTAMRAAAGRSNKQIAAERQLSVRTVESHLQRAYEKLGISGRHELASALKDQPTV